MTRSAALPVGTIAAALAAALAAWGTYGDTNPSTREYLVVLAIILAGAAIVYGLVVPRALGSQTVGRTALVLSALGLVSVAAFWAGLPPLLGFGGVMLGWHVRASSAGKIAVALGVLAFVAYVAVYVTDLS